MKKFLSLVLALVMTMSLVTISAGAKDFADDSDIDYKEAVDVISALGIVDGYSDSSFRPDGSLTRGAAAKIICNLILGPTTASALSATTAPFKDVPTTNVFAGYITYCAQQRIISGYGDGTFRPTGSLTGNAFMKMLLGALGYDSSIERYTGSNWQVNVTKQAIGIGLDDGNDEFVGSQAVTRQEAALYSFNMLQATMVEYDSKTTVNVNGATVTIAGDKAQDKSWGTGTNNDGNIDKDGFVQFAEQYFGDLRRIDGEDDFARPSNVWRLRGTEIGTYAKEADATYTAKVKAGDIYSDLNLGSTIVPSDVEIYVNGVEKSTAPSVAIRRGSDDTVGVSANGVLTEVYYDEDAETVTITQVLTYVGEVNRTVSASSNRDAYVEVMTSVNGSNAPSGASGTEDFETAESFDEESYVLYTFSEKEDQICSVVPAESVTGTVTRVVNKTNDRNNSGVTLGGTEYKASATMALDLLDALSVDLDYTAYLDEYGYVITVDEEDFGDYALVLSIQGASSNVVSGNFDTNRARLLFTDGTVRVVNLDKNYTTASNGGIDEEDIVTWRERENGYALRKVMDASASGATIVRNSSTFNLENDVARMTTGHASDPFYGNSNTMFVIYDNNNGYDAYTGVKAVPSVAAQDLDASGTIGTGEQVDAYWYCKNGNIATVMFIIPDDDRLVSDDSNDLLFLAGESVSDLIHDSLGDYYEYQAVAAGELVTVKVDAGSANNKTYNGVRAYALNGLFSSYTVNSDGIITALTPYPTSTTGDKFAGYGVGTDRRSADYTVFVDDNHDDVITAGMVANANQWWTVDEDALFFLVDEDGNIEAGSYGNVTRDEDDRAYFVVEDGMITYMFIEEVNTEDDAQAATVTVTGGKAATIGDSLVLTANVTLKDTRNDVITGYQWYYTDAPANYTTVSDVEAHATRIAGATGSTYTVDTSAAIAGRYYYCVVETYNDRVTGDDTAKGVGMSALTSVSSSRMTVIVNFVDNSGRVLGSLAPQELQADPGRNYITMSPATYSSQVASVLPHYEMADTRTQYVNFSANGIAQVDFEVEQTEFEVGLKVSGGFVFRHNGEIVTSVWMKQGESIDLTLGDADLVGGGGGWSTYYAHTSTSGFTVTDRTGTNNHEVAFTLTADTLTSDIDVTFTYDQTANS